MRKLIRVLPVITVLSLLIGTVALAQVQLVDHEEFRSGGALGPDLEALSPGPSSPTGTQRPPRVGPNIRANAPQAAFPNGLLGRSETTIAAAGNGGHLVAGWNDAQGFCGPPFGAACTPQTPNGLSGYASSIDGGLTWIDGGAPPQFNNVFTRGDPWLDVGGLNGNTFYYANLAVDAATGASLGISVHRGRFADDVFAWYDVRTFDSPNNPGNCVAFGTTQPTPCDFYDKEALVAAKDGSKAVYVSLTNFQELCNNSIAQFGFGQIEVWRSHDAGKTWQGPAIAGPEAADSVAACGFTGTLQQSSAPAIGPNGEVYVVWQFGPTFTPATSPDADIVVARSLDGGVTFDPPVKVADINSLRQNPPVGYNRDRINDHPRIAVATSGPNSGRVYVTFYSSVAPVTAPVPAPCPAPLTGLCRPQTLTSSQVFVSYSDDQGLTWSTPVPVAPAPPATGIKRFWPVVTVESGGNVDVIYYESQETSIGTTCSITVATGLRRRGPAVSLVDTYWAQSKDGGATWGAPVKASTATSNWCTAASNIRPNFGDYIGSAGGGDRVFPVWADGRNGVPDTFFANILGAGKSK